MNCDFADSILADATIPGAREADVLAYRKSELAPAMDLEASTPPLRGALAPTLPPPLPAAASVVAPRPKMARNHAVSR